MKKESNIQWMLPINESTCHREPLIYHNAKYHCFETKTQKTFNINRIGRSLCGKHKQIMDYYECIEYSDIKNIPQYTCKKCMEMYLKRLDRGDDL